MASKKRRPRIGLKRYLSKTPAQRKLFATPDEVNLEAMATGEIYNPYGLKRREAKRLLDKYSTGHKQKSMKRD